VQSCSGDTKLAEAFHRAGLIEHWGTGTLRIVRACEEHGLPRPEFRYAMGTFMAILRSAPATAEPSASLPECLNDRQLRAISHVREYKAISSAEYQAMYGVRDRQARLDLADLVRRGLLAAKGKGRATRYILPD